MIMNIKQLSLAAGVSALTFATTVHAVLGPIPIYLNAEYRTDHPLIGSISSTLTFSAEDIKATGANTFLDFLATIPSVALSNSQGNVPAIFMRGGNSDHTLVLVDGVSVNSVGSLNGAVEHGLTTIALNDIEKVEIIKGAGSVLYGSSAIAGVISITTKKGANGESANISSKFGTHNTRIYNLSASEGNQDGFARFTHNQYSTDGINAQTGDTANEKDGISTQTTQIKIGNQHFDASYLESSNKTEYDGWKGLNSGELADIKLNKITLNAHQKINDTWNTRLTLSQINSSSNSGPNATKIGNKYKRTSGIWLNDIKLGNSLLTVGLSKVDDTNTSRPLTHSSQDLFTNWQKNFGNLDINTGFRYIKHNKFGSHTVYDLGFGQLLGANIRLTANYNTAFQAPMLKEENPGTQTNNLKPETAKNINIGLHKIHSWGKVGLSLFNSKEKNVIKYTGGYPNSTYINDGEYSTKGVELSINANLAGYTIELGHTYAKSSVNNSAKQPAKRPKNISNLSVNKRYGKFNSILQITRKSSSLDGFPITTLPGYTLVNVSTDFALNKQTKISVNIDNLLNKNYTIAKGYNQLGRTLKVGLDYSF